MEQGPHTIWIDNFSKIMGCRIPSVDKGAWRNCLWTGVALREYKGSQPVSMDLMTDGDGSIPAMPDDPFAMHDKLLKLWKVNRVKERYWPEPFVKKWKIDNAPIKPVLHRVNDAKHHATLKGSNSRLLGLYPKHIIAENIGSNIGLGRIMRGIYEDNKQDKEGQCTKYTSLNADINIFDRIIKVNMYKVLHD